MTLKADVLVVGGGGAGLAAAIEAATVSRSVILFEKETSLGGSTAWSVGSISVNNSPHQRRQGIADSADAHFEDLETLAGNYVNRDNPELRRLLVDNIADTFHWLESMGLVFIGPMPELPHRQPRMHNVLPNSRAFPKRLGRRAQALGVDIRNGTQVTTLQAKDGRITGLSAVSADGQETAYEARYGVVLAGGDYSANAEMLRDWASDAAALLAPVNRAATGEGIRLGLAAGGIVRNGDIVRGPVLRFVPPPERRLAELVPPHPVITRVMRWGFESLPRRLIRPALMRFLTTALGLSPDLLEAGALLVNAEGRVIDGGSGSLAEAVARQTDGQAWILFDDKIARRFQAWPNFISTAPGIAYAYLGDYRRTRGDIYHQAADIAGLARAAGLPTFLAETVTAHNAALDSGEPRIDAPPFYALGPVKAYVVFTDGGLVVNRELQVLDAAGAPIPGLYAAGSNGQGGVMLEGHGHHLGWAFVSGRIAGANAARKD